MWMIACSVARVSPSGGGQSRDPLRVHHAGAGHPYLKLPLKFATSLRRALLNLVAASEFDRLLEAAEMELDAPTAGG